MPKTSTWIGAAVVVAAMWWVFTHAEPTPPMQGQRRYDPNRTANNARP